MIMTIHSVSILIILTGTAIVAQDISSFKLLPDECSTHCKCIFNYELTLTDTLPDASSLIFEIKEKSSGTFKKLYTLNLKNDCTGFVEGAEVYCTEIDRNVLIISINPKRMSSFHQAKCRAYLRLHNKTTNYTDTLNFPRIYDPLVATGQLQINGQNMSTDYCNTSIDVNELTLEFDCASAAQPCVIEMHVNDDTVVSHRGNHGVFKGTYNQGEDLLVTVKYAACSLDQNFNNISCRVATDFITIDDDMFIIILVIGIGIPIIIVLLVVICLVYRRRKKRMTNGVSEPLMESELTEERVINWDHDVRPTPGKASVKRKANVDQNNTDVWTPLMLAANKGHTSTVSKLIATGAVVNARGPEELTALMLASENGYLACVKKLLKSGADVNAKDGEGWTALMLASQNGHVDIVKYIINNNGNIEDRNNDDLTALIIASQNEQTEIVDLLEKGGHTERKNYKKPLKRKSTIYQSRSSCVIDNTITMNKEKVSNMDLVLKEFCKSMKRRDEDKDSIAANANITIACSETINKMDVKESTSEVRDKGKVNPSFKEIIVAIEKGCSETVERILTEGFDVNKQLGNGSNAIIFAAIRGRLEIVELLIKNKASVNDIDKNGFTALLHASEHGHTDVVKLLLDNGANVDKKENKSWSALMLAAQNGHSDTARLLVENGASVNDRERQGWTALMLASLYGHKETVKLLIDQGANLEEKEADGWTALMQSSINGHVETVSLLIERGAEMTKNEINGLTPLMLASQNGYAKTVQLLLDHGANVNDKEYSGFTALMLASQNGHFETVKLLIDNGANVHDKNSDDWTALMLASDNGHDTIVDLLSN